MSAPSVPNRNELYRQLFLQRNGSTTDAVYKGEQQYGEMNVARGRAVEAIRNRLELAQE